MSEQGGPEEAIDHVRERMAGYARVALTVAARMAEQAAHHRAELARRAEHAGAEHARMVQAHLRAEAQAVRFELRETRDPAWWDRATDEQMAHAWATARSYAGVDGELRGQARWMGQEIERRTGVAPEDLYRAAEREAAAARAEQAVAVALVADADRADRGYGAGVEVDRFAAVENREAEVGARMTDEYGPLWADRDDLPRGAEAGVRGQVSAAWDSVERRSTLSDRLQAAGVSPEAAEARLLSDRASGTRPSAAVTPIEQGQRPQRQPRPQPGRRRGVER